MKRLWVFCLCLPLFAADVVPNRYIVELSSEPVGAHLLRTAPRMAARTQLHSQEAETHRRLVRGEQAVARTSIVAMQGRVLGAVETVRNALVVEIADGQA